MAKNYMAHVAKMLGVELEEEFKLAGWDDFTFKFTDQGLYSLCIKPKDNEYEGCFDIVQSIILGNYEIIKIPWNPKNGNIYFYPSTNNKRVFRTFWRDNTRDYALQALGMCYCTREEAEAHFKEDYKKLTGKDLGKDLENEQDYFVRQTHKRP